MMMRVNNRFDEVDNSIMIFVNLVLCLTIVLVFAHDLTMHKLMMHIYVNDYFDAIR